MKLKKFQCVYELCSIKTISCPNGNIKNKNNCVAEDGINIYTKKGYFKICLKCLYSKSKE